MIMATLNRIRHLLDEQRRALLDQLNKVDRAIAALASVGLDSVDAPFDVDAQPDTDTDAGTVVPRRVKPKRVLSDSHKQALVHGNRKAREAREAAKGLAREMPADSFIPAIGTRAHREPPRLVKRPAKIRGA